LGDSEAVARLLSRALAGVGDIAAAPLAPAFGEQRAASGIRQAAA
jgi:hypothetical protein